MFASTLFADENDVRDFNLQIQNLLRHGRADEAAAIVETALDHLGDAHPVVALCRACPVEGIEIVGWDALADRISAADALGASITALGIDISWPGHSGAEADANGYLEPLLEANFYADSAFPFTTKSRDAIIEGYGPLGAEWQGRMAEIDGVLSLCGLGEVYGTVFPLVEHIFATLEPEAIEADAMRLSAAFIAIRVHQAVAKAIHQHGLPRPLAVLVGSNESYPFYDAPVVSTAESVEYVSAPLVTEAIELPESQQEDVVAGQAVIEEPEEPAVDPIAASADRIVQLSGAALRLRLGQQDAAPPSAAAGGIFRRLFVRKAAAG